MDASVGDAHPSDAAIVCPSGLVDCDGNPDNGCEAKLSDDKDNCGACHHACSATGTQSQACVLGVCKPICDATHLDCDGDGATGCEVDATNSVANCGACGHACSAAGTSTTACVNRVCLPTCDSKHGDCDGKGDTGCEVDVSTDVNNCGACTHSCGVQNAASRACVAGACAPTCIPNFGDCRTPATSVKDDGCETDLLQPLNCGACGRDCQGGACAAGLCQPMTLATSSAGDPAGLAVDPFFVHWVDDDPVNAGKREVMRISVSGQNLTQVTNNKSLRAIAANGTHVYWAVRSSSGTAPDGYIERVSTGSGAPFEKVRTGISPEVLAVDATNIYYSNLATQSFDQAGPDINSSVIHLLMGAIVLCAASDGSNIYIGVPGGLYVAKVGQSDSGAHVATMSSSGSPTGYHLAQDATHIYTWFGDSKGLNTRVAQLPKADLLKPVELFPPNGTVSASQLVVVGSYLYFPWTDGIYRVSTNGGGAPALVVAMPSTFANDIQSQGGALYWIERGDSSYSIRKLAVF